MRRAHYLKPNSASETPSNAVWFDTETDQVDAGADCVGHVLRFGWAAYSRTRGSDQWIQTQWLRFTTRGQFWEWVDGKTAPKKTLYLFCHNTSFDLPVLDVFGELAARGWKLTRAVIDAPPTMLTFVRGAAKLQVLDTLNIWRMSLRELGKMVGLPKLEMPAPTASAEDWDIYGKRDTEILQKACTEWWRFLRTEDMGCFAPTLASQSMRVYRHRFMTDRVLIHDTPRVLEMEREAYHGGRCECFRVGEFSGDFSFYDVNSLYPSVMQSGQYPVALAFTARPPWRFPIGQYLAEMCSIARCVIRTDTPMYPVVHGGKLVFPVGEFAATLAGPELMECWRRGHLHTISEIAFYHAAPMFRGFVDRLYAERLKAKSDGNSGRSWFIKILMNSLYGKFGQRGAVWVSQDNVADLTARAWREFDTTTRQVTAYRQLGGLVQRLETEPESADSAPAIAAYVTSYARLHLWRLIELAGRRNVYYCDTDSVTVNAAGARRLKGEVDPDALGKLKLERTTHTLTIYGRKDYMLDDTFRAKGVRLGAVWTARDTVQQSQWAGLRGQLAGGRLTMPTTRTITKHLRRVYDTGTVGAGGVVEPLELSPDVSGG